MYNYWQYNYRKSGHYFAYCKINAQIKDVFKSFGIPPKEKEKYISSELQELLEVEKEERRIKIMEIEELERKWELSENILRVDNKKKEETITLEEKIIEEAGTIVKLLLLQLVKERKNTFLVDAKPKIPLKKFNSFL